MKKSIVSIMLLNISLTGVYASEDMSGFETIISTWTTGQKRECIKFFTRKIEEAIDENTTEEKHKLEILQKSINSDIYKRNIKQIRGTSNAAARHAAESEKN